MSEEEFLWLVEATRSQHPFWFEGEHEGPSSVDEIAAAERSLGLTLPTEYRAFLGRFGGGYFGHTLILSARPESAWSLVEINTAYDMPPGFLAISDDQAGGFYGFLFNAGMCTDPVHFAALDERGAPNIAIRLYSTSLPKPALRRQTLPMMLGGNPPHGARPTPHHHRTRPHVVLPEPHAA